MLAQVAQRGSGISVLVGVQDSAWHGPKQADLIRPAYSSTLD